jgi:hypothetical protein
MEFEIKVLTDSDYDDILVKWWHAWRWTPPPKDSLPEDGKGGIIIYDGDVPVCAGFIYATNSKIAWIEFIISNREYRNKGDRNEAITLLVDTLVGMCRNTGFKYCFSILKNQSLLEVYYKVGFSVTDTNSLELIKIL